MGLKQELTDYEIGSIGDIKKHTLRFHSCRIGTLECQSVRNKNKAKDYYYRH